MSLFFSSFQSRHLFSAALAPKPPISAPMIMSPILVSVTELTAGKTANNSTGKTNAQSLHGGVKVVVELAANAFVLTTRTGARSGARAAAGSRAVPVTITACRGIGSVGSDSHRLRYWSGGCIASLLLRRKGRHCSRGCRSFRGDLVHHGQAIMTSQHKKLFMWGLKLQGW